MSEVGQRLRHMISNCGYTVAPGAYGTLTARPVEQAGYDVVYLTGGGYSRASGFPDPGLLTMSEIASYYSRTADAVSIPVIGDADAGYGNAVNVIRMVREYEKTGIAGFHIEDQIAPKKCGHYEAKQVVSLNEMVGKTKAAVDTRKDPDLMIIARTDARAVQGLNAAIERVSAYVDAEADPGFVEAPQSLEELAEITGQEPRACFCNIFEGGKTPAVTAVALERMGYKLGIYPSQTNRAAFHAVRRALRALREDGSIRRIDSEIATFAEREAAVNSAWWHAAERKYMAAR